MKKLLLIVPLLIVNSISAISQTTATDFTANDCSGVSHHLFNELDEGKIIVITFVMPCGACIGPSLSANSSIGSYQSDHPGRVIYYLSDDNANTTCASLYSWATTNGFGKPLGITLFSTPEFKQIDYGAPAMPKTVVLAGNDHKIIYVEDDILNPGNMKTAIDNALLNTAGITNQAKESNELIIAPNPAKHDITINYSLAAASFVTMDIYNIAGIKVKTIAAEKQQAGKHEIRIKLDDNLSNGMYFLEMNTPKSCNTYKFTIAN